jgi:heptosyltransferase-1
MIHAIEGCAGVVGGDSGLVHLAAALGIPALAIFGPTNPQLTGLLGERGENISVTRSCSPCMLKRCPHMDEEVVTEPPCLSGVKPEPVWQALHRLLDGAGAPCG